MPGHFVTRPIIVRGDRAGRDSRRSAWRVGWAEPRHAAAARPCRPRHRGCSRGNADLVPSPLTPDIAAVRMAAGSRRPSFIHSQNMEVMMRKLMLDLNALAV